MYRKTINSILNVCKTIKLNKMNENDGRLYSATQEQIYLNELSKKLIQIYPNYLIDISKSRSWYDISINDIKINLKITDGNTDNIFNKKSILYTLSGKEVYKNNMNWKNFTNELRNINIKKKRNKQSEYHYLVIYKESNNILLKSILDLKKYRKNPSNIIQINWDFEYKHINYKSMRYKSKISELLNVINLSIKSKYDDMYFFLKYYDEIKIN